MHRTVAAVYIQHGPLYSICRIKTIEFQIFIKELRKHERNLICHICWKCITMEMDQRLN